LFYGVGGGGGDSFEGVECLGAGFEEAEGEGKLGEVAEGGQVGRDGGGLGEGEELVGLEDLPLGEGDQVVSEKDEGVEEVGFGGGERGKRCGLSGAGGHGVWNILGIGRCVNSILFGISHGCASLHENRRCIYCVYTV
jgi:hypothetical protein